MSENVQIALIVASGPTLTGLVSALISWLNNRKLREVHRDTNGQLQKLMDKNSELRDKLIEEGLK